MFACHVRRACSPDRRRAFQKSRFACRCSANQKSKSSNSQTEEHVSLSLLSQTVEHLFAQPNRRASQQSCSAKQKSMSLEEHVSQTEEHAIMSLLSQTGERVIKQPNRRACQRLPLLSQTEEPADCFFACRCSAKQESMSANSRACDRVIKHQTEEHVTMSSKRVSSKRRAWHSHTEEHVISLSLLIQTEEHIIIVARVCAEQKTSSLTSLLTSDDTREAHSFLESDQY